jgi:hypothetical protein
MSSRTCNSFKDFYPFYLSEHANRTSRRLHFIGTSIAFALLITAFVRQLWILAAIAYVQGYLFAWIGHFFSNTTSPPPLTAYPGGFHRTSWRHVHVSVIRVSLLHEPMVI